MDVDKSQLAALGAQGPRAAAPKRYTGEGRETWDRQRDLARALARDLIRAYIPNPVELGDFIFAAHCQLTALKYSDRCGLKPGTDDAAKHDDYMDMVRHVLDGAPDPRSERPTFTPYSEVLFVE